MKLDKILKGTSIMYGGIQSIQGLTIIPLVCDPQYSFDNDYASPFAHNVSTTSYGVLNIHPAPNETKKILVLPQSTYITKGYSAQDHLMSKAALIKGKPKTFNDARCVESSQGGFIRTTGNNEMVIAPLKLREIAFNYVGKSGYSQLWNSISSFNRSHGAGSNAQIKDYFSKWDKDLDTFIAHFERLENCIGFITLHNDEVVAVDKFPSFTYTSQIWEKLVRDSYASLVIQDRLNKIPQTGNLKRVSDVKSNRKTLWGLYQEVVSHRSDHYKLLLEEIMDVDFAEKKDKDTTNSTILEANGYIGQIIEEGGVNILVSIIKKDSFKPESMRKTREMRQLAISQRDFSL